MVDVTLGHSVATSIGFLDQNGNPMLVTPTVDAPPQWSNGNNAVDTLVASADGMTAEITTVAVGQDTISMSLASGGKQFSATMALSVDAVPQVLTSVVIDSVVS